MSSSSICLLLRRIKIWCFGTRKREKLTVDNYNACQSFTEQFSATAIDLLQHFQWYALLLISISLLAFYLADDSLLHGSTSRILIGKHPIHSTSGFFDSVAISFDPLTAMACFADALCFSSHTLGLEHTTSQLSLLFRHQCRRATILSSLKSQDPLAVQQPLPCTVVGISCTHWKKISTLPSIRLL